MKISILLSNLTKIKLIFFTGSFSAFPLTSLTRNTCIFVRFYHPEFPQRRAISSLSPDLRMCKTEREPCCACANHERGTLLRLRRCCTVPPPASQSEAAILQREPSKRALSYIVQRISRSLERRELNANSDALIGIVCGVF